VGDYTPLEREYGRRAREEAITIFPINE